MKPFPLLYLPDSPEFWAKLGEYMTDEQPGLSGQHAAPIKDDHTGRYQADLFPNSGSNSGEPVL